ncbi:hypothetical protein KVR01_011858 [Diaporthe batatas]|uniref:uncharacterized protein n=1 Tax=Diaporthe batatas TaxID=748121 RepID=UPI001D051456|nr:uncharacterized protein KVR01_011858 [Diaporthe batatas]KAG8158097.1 hypothetical protein KVR01_011858 [Diaporthe batatas]
MDTNAACDHSREEESDSKDFVERRSSPERDQLSEFGTKCQRDREHEGDVPDVTAEPTSKNASPLLLLPGELRNEIYGFLFWFTYFTFEQPPITRVNREIRHEALGIYYHSHIVNWVHVAKRPRDNDDQTWYHGGTPYLRSDRLGNFVPRPGSGIQTNSLRYLQSMYLRVDVSSGTWPAAVGLTIKMSATEPPRTRCGCHQKMNTEGLSWDDEVQVGKAFLEAATSCDNITAAAKLVGDDRVRRGVEGTESEVARVMCLLARLNPKLTKSVVITVLLTGRYI